MNNVKNFTDSNPERLRRLRIKLGIDRKTMADRLGLGVNSYKQVELGHCILGQRKWQLIDRWEKGDMTGYGSLHPDAVDMPDVIETGKKRQMQDRDIMVDLLLDKETSGKIADIARITGCELRTAARKLLEIELEKKNGG